MNKGIKKKWSTARILKTIKKINVKDNDVLVFQVKTNRHGLPDMPLDYLYDFYKTINKTLTEKTNTNAFAFFVTDKIPLYSH